MNNEQNGLRMAEEGKGNLEFSPIEMLIVLAKHKKLILGFPLVVGAIAAAISFSLPNEYKATARLLPPQQSQSSAVALLSQLGGMASAAAGAAGLKNPNDMYVGMLKSRTIADKLIARFDLKHVYETESQDKARLRLDKESEFNSGKDGLITIEVEDRDPKRVAAMANAYVEELLNLTSVLAVTEATQRRMFFQKELERAKDNLAKAEMTLKLNMDTKGVVSVDGESRAMVETVGRVRAQVSAKEIELNAMRAFVTESNPDFRRTQEELSSLRAELSKLENGRGEPAAGVASGKAVAGLENVKVLRDVKYYQMLYELLAKQYEAARIDESKDSAAVQVLDKAVVPEERDKPKRTIIVLLSIAFAGVLAVAWAFISESKRRASRDPIGSAQLAELRSHLGFSKRTKSQ
jgi:uncharacterized protein involved in exopolysaccharide biosynthesis